MAVSEVMVLVLLVLGAAFMIFEAIAPGADLVVLGTALFISGLAGWIIPGVTVPILLVIFIISGVITFYGYRNLLSFDAPSVDQTADSDSLRYTEGVALEDIDAESGWVRLDEGAGMSTEFQARYKYGTIKEGTRIIVTDSGGGSILEVMEYNEFGTNKNPDLSKETE